MNANGGSAQWLDEPSLLGDEPLRRVGRFDLVTRLGSGGMANVYLARHQGAAGFERLAAIKVMHRHLSSDEQFVQMFFDEARVAARIHHPNVVPILEIGTERDQLYMVMDYIEGDTLAAVQRAAIGVRRAIPVGIVLRIILDALSGLDNAHELCGPDGEPLNVVHRDISPQNILVGVDGVARVVDFGIARAERRLALTSVGTLKGKAPFMAPEHLEGRPVDRRADVFSMAVTMWESFALRRLYPQRSDVEVVTRAQRVAYRPLRGMFAQMPPEVDEILARALAYEVDDRFNTAAEFAEALDDRLRASVASHRQVATFMAAIAGEKVAAEREAVRLTPPGAADSRSAVLRQRSGTHPTGVERTPTALKVPPPPGLPDLGGMMDFASSSKHGELPDLPDLDVATSVSHLTDSIAPRFNRPAVQPVRSPTAPRGVRAVPSAGEELMEPEPLSTRPGGGVQVVRSHVVGARDPAAKSAEVAAPPRKASKTTAAFGIAAPRRGDPPPPPVARSNTAEDIEETMRQLGVSEHNALLDKLETISSVRRTHGPVVGRGATPAWGSGSPQLKGSKLEAAFDGDRGQSRGASAPTPAMGSILPPSTETRVGGFAGGASHSGRHAAQGEGTGRHAAQGEGTGRFNPAPPRAAEDTTRLLGAKANAIALLDDDGEDRTTDVHPEAEGQEKRLPSTFIAPPETSHARVLANAAAAVSLASIAAILWLVLR